jgi:hypothetical protein
MATDICTTIDQRLKALLKDLFIDPTMVICLNSNLLEMRYVIELRELLW